VHAHALAKHIKIIPGDYTQEAGISAAPEILNSTMTAVFIGNDERAVGLAGAALRAGVAIPEQLSIVGYDDSPAARTFACVSPPSNKMPRTYPALPSTQSYNALDEGRTDSGQVVITPRLVIRGTTAAPTARQA